MITSLNGKNSKTGNSEEREDLTRIRGIGSVKQQWLRELLNIHTFQDLASFSVDEIESRLRAEGHTASRSEIKGWIVQAQELIAAKLPSQQSLEFAEAETEVSSNLSIQKSESSQPLTASVDAETREKLLSTPQAEWQSFASFRVEFQSRKIEGQREEQRTTIHYLEADKFQSWSDIDSDQLQQWMMDQVSEEIQQSLEAESPVAVPSMSVNIAQIRTFQPPQTERPMVVTGGNRLFPGTISRGEPFAIEIAFSLAGLNLANFTKKPVTYRAQFYARNRLTGAGIHLGDTEPCTLLKGQLYYTAILAETTLEAGAYRLQALVTLQGVPVTLGSFKIPLLQVV